MREALIGGAAALLAGAALGLVFFGGLWWTVRRAASFRHPGVAVFASLLLRSGVTLAGFLVVAGDQWPRWLLCLLGFITARAATGLALGRSGRAGAAPAGPELAAGGDRHAA
jgi:F1F0 ATPase subunit 2